MTTEVYSCKDGQPLKEGKLDYAPHITDKEQAQTDALRRCQKDPTLKKVAYYKISPDGEFRIFYSYTNPNCKPAVKRDMAASKPKRAVKKAPVKLGLFARIKRTLGL